MRLRQRIVCGLLLTASGCVRAKPVIGPDGTEHQLISCNDIDSCYQKASQVCGGSYRVVDKKTTETGVEAMHGSSSELLVKCGKDGATAPPASR